MILIFGAAGFIDTYLSDQLLRGGYDVMARDLSEIGAAYYHGRGIPYHRVDITQKAELERLPIGGIQVVAAATAGPLPAAALRGSVAYATTDERLLDSSRWALL